MQHQSIHQDRDEEEEQMFDGQPGTDGYGESSKSDNSCLSILMKIVRLFVYLFALLFVIMLIVIVLVVPGANKPNVSDVNSTLSIPMQNQSTWIVDGNSSNITSVYPPWVMLQLDFSVENPNRFALTFETEVDLYAYDYRTENSTAYHYLDSFVFEKTTFDMRNTAQKTLQYNLTRINLLKQIGTWIVDIPSKQRELKLTSRSTKIGVDLLGISINIGSTSTDTVLTI